jgi:hypothetical protein
LFLLGSANLAEAQQSRIKRDARCESVIKVKKGVRMKSKSVFFASVLVLALTLPSLAQENKVGNVRFPTSCDPKVQADFERGVAMLHSFWYSAGEKIFGAGSVVRHRHVGHRSAFNVQSTRRSRFFAQGRGAGTSSD